MPLLNIAIIGRPNVGKSTLYNRLVGKRDAIVHDLPGVTRDRKYGTGSIGGLEFALIDTPGLEDLGKSSLAGRMSQQSLKALDEADVALFIIDARAGITTEDERFARMLRTTNVPIILVANKTESRTAVESTLIDAYRLGLDTPVPISAEHGEGLAGLYEAIVAHDKSTDDANDVTVSDEDKKARERPIRIAILGRPNVGKSTFVNSLIGEERILTGPEAGMTRDSVTLDVTWDGRDYVLVDTAGMRKRAKVTKSLEQLSVSATTEALKYTDVAILMLDATQPLEKQDNAIAGLIEREGRGCVVVLNKADQISIDDSYIKAFQHRIHHVVPGMRDVTIVPVVATVGKNIDLVMDAVCEVYDIWNTRISTARLNEWLDGITQHHSPPLIRNRRLKFRYMTQSKARPPTFVVFANIKENIPDAYIRYLTNQLRQQFNMPGVPIRLLVRTGNNPYANKKD